MIRINLIGGERRAVKSSGRTLLPAHKVALGGAAVFIVTAALVGWRYWALTEHEAQLALDIAAAQREETRLAEVLKQVAAFDAQGAQLRERVTLIDELRRGQNAPVHMVDQISRSLPEMTWLTSLKQQGYEITIEGQSTTLSALSDFIGNLEATRYFKRPVEIVQSEVAEGQNDDPDLIEFTIKGTFQMEGIETPVATPAGKQKASAAASMGGSIG